MHDHTQTLRHPGRRAVLAGLGTAACNTSKAGRRAAGTGDSAGYGPLDVVVHRSTARAKAGGPARGGTAVVLLHGWGAAGDDLVPLAGELADDNALFFIPAAPLPEIGGGRAWWRLSGGARPAAAYDLAVPAGHKPNPDIASARLAVQTLLRAIKEHHSPDVLAVVGFSQGAMLALDIALEANPPVNRVAALSGVLLLDSVPALLATKPPHPAVFVSHGRGDDRLPFRAGERAKDLLTDKGFPVTFRPFDGGHGIPAEIVPDLRTFLFSA